MKKRVKAGATIQTHNKTSMYRYSMNKIIIAVAVISLLMMISPLLNNAYAGGKGLRVIVTVENVPNSVVGQNAQMTVTSNSDARVHKTVTIPDASSFYTELQFARGEVDTGEGFSACVYINSDLNECVRGTNGKDKAPERVTIFLPNSGNNQGGDQSSSSSSAANDGSAASSSSSSSKSCLAFC